LSGSLVDRAALYGVLTMIETLGLELVELRQVTSSELVSRMVRAGELEVPGDDQAEVDTYFGLLAPVDAGFMVLCGRRCRPGATGRPV